MKSKRKKFMAFAIAAMLMLPTVSAYASNVTFTDYTYTTTPCTEVWSTVTSKTKSDSEQNWYVTLTSQSGLGSTSQTARALVISNDSSPGLQGLNPYPIYSTTTSSGAIAYQKTVYANSKYYLYISGNENLSTSYVITISGRYTSVKRIPNRMRIWFGILWTGGLA